MCIRDSYGNALLYGINKQLTNKLQRIQITAARIITRTRKHDRITPVLINLHWLPVDHHILYKIMLYVFKCLNNLALGYLTEFVIPYNPTKALRSKTSNLLTVPSVRTKTYGERRYDKAASILWNNLTRQLRNAKNIECFKRLLKTHLFRQAYNLSITLCCWFLWNVFIFVLDSFGLFCMFAFHIHLECFMLASYFTL